MSKRRPDPVDERILRLLVRNARLSWRDVGETVGLSANAVAQRVKRLENDGWVLGYTARLDPGVSEQGATALIQIRTTTDVDIDDIEADMAAIPAVQEILDLAGPVDYQVRVRYSTQRELYETVNALRLVKGVTAIETRPVLREVLSR
ncbi:MAG: Lrp/AsnC family transcriptional regulator, leucine-responsive regulatory protein [Frankiaceae bacterium]|jgi:Lrp/AsnC family leucine-responsive transcriptional regulator|nr:Lrp/AsnC family transcriptional regulator, leucine-responsive regulatory protein [Frankiaceae bacterium]MDQ1650034.1 Lrp/AsnC family transcriptional regulator, leucine-responsive regulatory protein [Frankiaceae bacterium]MDQ1672421.1 Lrp/AsnC family transcriptional regulator, leucine-responsive regulatory protein [Frankiaceae bacterium]